MTVEHYARAVLWGCVCRSRIRQIGQNMFIRNSYAFNCRSRSCYDSMLLRKHNMYVGISYTGNRNWFFFFLPCETLLHQKPFTTGSSYSFPFSERVAKAPYYFRQNIRLEMDDPRPGKEICTVINIRYLVFDVRGRCCEPRGSPLRCPHVHDLIKS